MNRMGQINSVQSLGAADGPGIRYVLFMQGCPLRCSCCHNPDTWEQDGGTERSAADVFTEIKQYLEYFGEQGGLTISGGEPLLQPEFCTELFTLCKSGGISTCLDTSGCILNEKVQALLAVTDLVLLDIKYTDQDSYKAYVGCSLGTVLDFFAYLSQHNIATRIRQVIIEGKNDTRENIERLREFTVAHKNVEKIELLPFKTLCSAKYEALRIPFPFRGIPPTSAETMEKMNALLAE